MVPFIMAKQSDVARWIAKVAIGSGCWEWEAARCKAGYGLFHYKGSRSCYAHRFAYEAFVGPIPKGKHLDHLCRNRGCVNPAHVEPVTSKENLLRSPVTQASLNRAKTHCKYGHEFSEENTYMAKIVLYRSSGRTKKYRVRQCKECGRRRRRERYHYNKGNECRAVSTRS